jgi:predicted ABC-type ATPase
VRRFILVLAGVNGAGKSSVGGSILQDHGLTWFNPDTYARELVRELGMDAADANARAWQYGKATLESAIANGTNYAFETTLGGNTITALLLNAAQTHDVVMLYCGLASPALHLARVALRVAHGGHHIAEEKIRERWNTSRLNLIKLLPSLARLQVFDNSTQARPGEDIPDPALVLDVENGKVLVPDNTDAVALQAVPAWARPVVEVAMRHLERSARISCWRRPKIDPPVRVVPIQI